MPHRTTYRVIAAGALALVLALAGAVPAQARELAGPGGLWQWLTRAWESGFSLLRPWTKAPGAPAESGARGVTPKEGPGLDPNGGSKPAPGGTGSTTCSTCDGGTAAGDPNG
jgi:hypothetical protein